MALAAAISVSLTSLTRRSRIPHQSSASTILQFNSFLHRRETVRPRLGLVAAASSMSVEAAKKASPASFLHRRETFRPRLGLVAAASSMSVEAAKKASPASFLHRRETFRPRLRLVAAAASSMSVEAAEKASPASFLHRRETVRPRLRLVAAAAAASSMSVEAAEKASPARILYVVKYPGLGNDFILVDNRDSSEPKFTPEQAVRLCDRNIGIGADGVIFVLPGINGADYTMRIFNSDGSPIKPEMCGNGVRCFARFITELENLHGNQRFTFIIELENLHGNQRFTVHTSAGLIVPEIVDDGKVRVDMGEPILKASDVPTKLPPNNDHSVVKAGLDVDGVTWNVTCVSMGNPHCITFGTEGGQNLQVDESSLAEIGPKFEHHEVFPARTNTAEPAPQWKYDVFLNFRGEDTRGSFISHLHHELEKSGIRTFKDDEQLEIGEDISQSLLMAIEESRSAIIVLSKNYAFSPWCLNELRKICRCMKGKGRILPIFLDVDPSVVRHQKDTFGAALEKHARSGRYGIVKVKQWIAVLKKVGNLKGWNSKNYKTERDLIGDIVKFVLKTVRQST